MATLNSTVPRSVARRRPATLASALADLLLTLTRGFDAYRPELHYMRGPGPKWHAKHDPAPAPGMRMPALARVRAR